MNANVHEIVSFGILIVVLATAGVWDYRTDKIPNWLTLWSAALGFVWAAMVLATVICARGVYRC